MTDTDQQPLDLDAIRRAVTHYAQTGSDDVAHELTAELLPLIREVERLRADTDRREEAAWHRGWDAAEARYAAQSA